VKSRKIAYIMMTLSFVMIISGSVASFVINLQEDRETMYKRMDDVNNTFEVFSTNTSVFESARDELYNIVLGNVYYETMFMEDVNIKTRLSNYENLVDQLKKNVSTLNNLCNDVYYPSSEANSRCQNYKSIYEQVVNYFVTDIKVYNDNVKKYNEYQTSIGSTYQLKEYVTKKIYIDYNGDKKFDGKEE